MRFAVFLFVLECVLCTSAYVYMAVKPKRKASSKKKKAAVKPSVRGFGGLQTRKGRVVGKPLANSETDKLFRWADTRGADLRKVCLADFNGMRGVMALEDIPAGEAVVRVPYEAAIDLGEDAEDIITPALTFLELWTDEKSSLRPYFDILPRFGDSDVNTFDFFSDEELALLQCPPMETRVRSRIGAVRGVRDTHGGSWPVFNGVECPENTLKWAVWVIVSRVVTAPGRLVSGMGGIRQPPRKLLIPILDMFNHAPGSPHNFAGQVGGDLKVVAGAPILAGDEICITYGNGMNGNDHFAGDYGFVDPSCLANDRKLVKAWMELSSEAEALLGGLTFVEDETILLQGGLSANEELAVRFRMAMKRAYEGL